MGHDITPIGKHQLNNKSFRSLADDILSRFDINLKLAYFGFTDFYYLLGENKDSELVEIDFLIKNPKFKTYLLIDEKYQIEQIVEKFGEDIFDKKKFWRQPDNCLLTKEQVDRYKMEYNYPIYNLEYWGADDFEVLTIHKDNYVNQMPYYSRWWTFCCFFVENKYIDAIQLKTFNDFRKQIQFYNQRLGGEKMYYLDDQNPDLEGVAQGAEAEMTWKEFEVFVLGKTSDLLLDIPLFLMDESYRKKFLAKNEYPLGFVDDFRDLQ